jgi:hypothetical protein|tara:strand:+ start:823 stop:981 length:159 start_codon:yes stop_codon:yes gene_type:complete
MGMIKNRRISQHMGDAFGAGRIKASHNAIQSSNITDLLQEFEKEGNSFNEMK